MKAEQLSVFLENRAGRLAEVIHILAGAGINIRALSLADVQDYGILRVIVDNVYVTSTVLKNAGYVFRITPVIAVPLEDQSGCLADVLDVLGRNDINVEYLYAFVGRQQNRAFVIFRVSDEDIEKASKILNDAGYPPISQDDLQLNSRN